MLRSIASTPSANRRNRKRKTCRRGAGGAIARPAGSVLARADMGDEVGERGQSQCCGEPGAVEGYPLARQRPVEVDAAVDRLHPVSESAKHKKKNLSARRRWGHGPSHSLLAPSSRARTWVTKQVNAGNFC